MKKNVLKKCFKLFRSSEWENINILHNFWCFFKHRSYRIGTRWGYFKIELFAQTIPLTKKTPNYPLPQSVDNTQSYSILSSVSWKMTTLAGPPSAKQFCKMYSQILIRITSLLTCISWLIFIVFITSPRCLVAAFLVFYKLSSEKPLLSRFAMSQCNMENSRQQHSLRLQEIFALLCECITGPVHTSLLLVFAVGMVPAIPQYLFIQGWWGWTRWSSFITQTKKWAAYGRMDEKQRMRGIVRF